MGVGTGQNCQLKSKSAAKSQKGQKEPRAKSQEPRAKTNLKIILKYALKT